MKFLIERRFWFFALPFSVPISMAPVAAFITDMDSAVTYIVLALVSTLWIRITEHLENAFKNFFNVKDALVTSTSSYSEHCVGKRTQSWRFFVDIAPEIICCFCYLYASLWRDEHKTLFAFLLLYSVFWTFVIWKFFIREREKRRSSIEIL